MNYESQLKKRLLLFTSANGIAQLAVIAASPLLTRVYSSTAFGNGSAFVAAVMILVPLATLRYDFAIPVPEEDEDAAQLLFVSALVSVLYFFLLLLLSRIFPWSLLEFEYAQDIKDNTGLICLGVLALGLNTTFNAWIMRIRQVKNASKARIVSVVCLLSTQLFLGYFVSSSGASIIMGFVAGQLAGLAYLMFPVFKSLKTLRAKPSVLKMKQISKKYKDYPLISCPGSLVNIVTLNIQPIFIAATFGASIAGQYSLARLVLQQPVNILSQSISQIYYREAADLYKSNPRQLNSLFLKLSILLITLTGAGFLVTPFFNTLFPLIFGGEWSLAGDYAKIVYIMAATCLVSNSLSALPAMGFNKTQGVWEIVRMVSVVLLFKYALDDQITPGHLVYLLVGFMAIFYVFNWLLNFSVIRREYRKGRVPKLQ